MIATIGVVVYCMCIVAMAVVIYHHKQTPRVRAHRLYATTGWQYVQAAQMDDMPHRYQYEVARYIDGETSTLDFLLNIERPPLPGDNASAVLAETRDAFTSTRSDAKTVLYNDPPIGYGWDHSGDLVPYSASYLKQALQRCDDAKARHGLWQAYQDAQTREAKRRAAAGARAELIERERVRQTPARQLLDEMNERLERQRADRPLDTRRY